MWGVFCLFLLCVFLVAASDLVVFAEFELLTWVFLVLVIIANVIDIILALSFIITLADEAYGQIL